jgi:predicted nucleic acid-binding protein
VYLVDTNVISEARTGKRANRGVQNFFQASDATELYVAVQTIGEIRRDLENIRQRGDLPQAKRLESWFDLLVPDYADRILSFDEGCRPIMPIDKQICYGRARCRPSSPYRGLSKTYADSSPASRR